MTDFSKFIYLYKKGSEYNAYSHLGAHFKTNNDIDGVEFSVFAPNAKAVYLSGDFNSWNEEYIMQCNEGVWNCFIENAKKGQLYKYIVEDINGKRVFKADPYGTSSELRPKTASAIEDPSSYRWSDKKWMTKRKDKDYSDQAINIYEVQLSSWDSIIKNNKCINIRKTGKALVEYVKSMHYTHIELMPITEYPLDASWGYQCTGYFSLSGRYGKPEDMQYFIDLCHKEGIGVILDWVPGHYCPDEHGLAKFDGSDLYGDYLHPHWGTYNFDFKNKSVWSFLLSSAVFWAKLYHIDGIRVDGVTSMLFLNYGSDEIIKRNKKGGEDDLDAKKFLQSFNNIMHKEFSGFLTFAEESSSYKGVTAPTQLDGLGFDFKWNMGWMNDTLDYFSKENKKELHNKLTFSSVYMRDEKFTLPFSHDEVVHGKKHLLEKLPGNDWEKFALLRTMMAYQIFHPGKKLSFMGIDIAQRMEWRYYEATEWFMLEYPIHDSFNKYIKTLNRLYLDNKALYDMDNDVYGFEWIDANNTDQSVFSFIRRAKDKSEIIVVLNMSKYEYSNFRLGVPKKGIYKEILSSNIEEFDGSGSHNKNDITALKIGCHKREYSIEIIVPPLSATAFKID